MTLSRSAGSAPRTAFAVRSFVQAFTDQPEERFAAGSVLVAEPAGAGPLRRRPRAGTAERLVVRFEGIDDRGDAETLRGTAVVHSRVAIAAISTIRTTSTTPT